MVEKLSKIEQRLSKTEIMGYKKLELMRFYISKDIQKIEDATSQDKYQLSSTISSAMVNALIAIFFRNEINEFCIEIKIIVILGLLVFSFLLEKFISDLRKRYDLIKKESGREALKERAIYEKIDKFDNIACDGILICLSYIDQYHVENGDIKDFYFFEIIHYMKKACNIFLEIRKYPERYTKDTNKALLDLYRIKNFIKLSKEVNTFLQSQKDLYKDETILNDILKIDIEVSKW